MASFGKSFNPAGFAYSVALVLSGILSLGICNAISTITECQLFQKKIKEIQMAEEEQTKAEFLVEKPQPVNEVERLSLKKGDRIVILATKAADIIMDIETADGVVKYITESGQSYDRTEIESYNIYWASYI